MKVEYFIVLALLVLVSIVVNFKSCEELNWCAEGSVYER